MDLGRAHSFMEEPEDFNLDDTLFADDVDGGDLGNIFDDDDGDDLIDTGFDSAKDTDNGEKNSNPKSAGGKSKKENKKESGEEQEDATTTQTMTKKRRRSGLSVDVSGPELPPSWHNQAADRPHREAMIREIAQLLKDRKKTALTKEWMKQLPHKSRVLEDRLYKNAPNLEAYLDRTTLKNRLRKVAVSITAQYKKSTKSQRPSKTGRYSSCSFSTLFSEASHRDSISSNMGPPRAIKSGNASQRNSVTSQALATPTSANIPTSLTNLDSQSTLPPEQAMSDLSKQKAANEELQRQILENIRQQQQLVQSISRGSNAGQDDSKDNNSKSSNSGGNNNSGVQGNSLGDSSGNSASAGLSGNQFTNNSMQQQQNPINSNIQQNNQMAYMLGNQMNGMQGNLLANMNMQGNHQLGNNMQGNNMMTNASGMNDPSFALMRHTSAPDTSTMSGGNFNVSQAALMRQQSMPMPNGSNGMNPGAMQSAFMRRGSTGNGTDSQTLQQQQQAALMRQMSNPQGQNQDAALAQMQAMMMMQGGPGNAHFNSLQSGPMNHQTHAAMMRQMSGGGSNQFNPSANVMQSEMMRRASFGNNNSTNMGSSDGSGQFGPHTALMNQQQQMSNNGGGVTRLPNGQVVPTQLMQQNPVMVQQMNAANMQQQNNMPQNFQQQMNMASSTQQSQNGNFGNMANFQAKKSGDNSDVSRNSFNW